ncbi:hypothetical protein [Paraburkholderia dilworthii]|uniref:hypothetical protein n=1 Tax=Paraburkholderia dilworthii TaxID=948106 RepID=UPI000480EBA0|nr:hypothetical protein [Paraburkholderia dilworthii]
MAAEAEIVAAILRGGCPAIAMDDARVQAVIAMKPEHRSLENGIKASVRFPASEGAINGGMVDFGTAMPILLDGQLLALAAETERLQDVVENRMRTFGRARDGRCSDVARQIARTL